MAQTESRRWLTVWLIDDGIEHHLVAGLTAASLKVVELECYATGKAALAEYAMLARSEPDRLPEVVLMDFYLGDERGDVVTGELRQLEADRRPLTIVGYSSVHSGSERIVQAGGNAIVRKHRDDRGVNPSLRQFLADYLAARG